MRPTVHIDTPVNGLVTTPASEIYGWIAIDRGSIERLLLFNSAGTTIPLEMHPRPDVASTLPGRSTSGFNGWIDIRNAAVGPWCLRCITAEGMVDTPIPLAADPTEARAFEVTKAAKLQRVRALLRCPFCKTELHEGDGVLQCDSGHTFPTRPDAFDFLDPETRERVGAVSTRNVSAHGYDGDLLELIAQSPGPILDVGAGLRPTYRADVINVEIVPYPTTDVIGAGEYLPFADEAFDLIISVAVLEHVRDPFAAARELQRILKPGGRIFAAVPFLQPFHAYPNHFYNMTSTGLTNLFSGLDVERLGVPMSGGPAYTLTWILQAWRNALPPEAAAAFNELRVSDLAVDPVELLDRPFVRELPPEAIVALASLNVLVGRKPARN